MKGILHFRNWYSKFESIEKRCLAHGLEQIITTLENGIIPQGYSDEYWEIIVTRKKGKKK